MIRIHRPTEGPGILTEHGSALVREMLTAYTSEPRSYQDGSRVFAFEKDVYGHPEVRRSLLTAQHKKCAYCEVRIVSETGDIEHFRPKASVRQAQDQPRRSPGYFWLAYTWNNLLQACSRCNREYKRDIFPLEDPAARASALREEGSTEKEAPLLLDPTTEEPELHIGFNGERAEPRNGGRQGRVTSDVLKLNRPVLLEERWEKLQHIRKRVECLRLVRAGRVRMDGPEGEGYLRELCREILEATESRAEFAGMIRSAVRQWFAPGLGFPCTEEALISWAQPGVDVLK